MRRALWAVIAALAACGPAPAPVAPQPQETPPASVASPPTVRSLPDRCDDVPPAKAPPFHLSIIDRYPLDLVGPPPTLFPVCNDLGVSTKTGLRIFSTETGHFVGESLPFDAIFEPVPNGGIASWNAGVLALQGRKSGAPIWSRPGVSGFHHRLHVAGDLLVSQLGRVCEPTCTMLAVKSDDGTEAWRRACPCDPQRRDEVYNELAAVDGVILAARANGTVEAWSPSTGATIWERPPPDRSQALLRGRFVVFEDSLPATRIQVLDAAGHDLATLSLPYGHKRIEATAADRDFLVVATSLAPEYGGRTRVAITGWNPVTKDESFHAIEDLTVERRYASTPASLWLDPSTVYFHDPDTGLLSSFNRRTGDEVSTLGVAQRTLVRTTTGFAMIDDDAITFIGPRDDETPPAERITVEGIFRLDGKPMGGVDLLVANTPVKSQHDGRFRVTIRARGRIGIAARQPTTATSTAYWADASTIVVTDGRNGPYPATIDAKRDTYD